MAVTKITLSAKELSMVMDDDWILTKQLIIQKVYDLFAALVPSIQSGIGHRQGELPAAIFSSVPKIYKGENYLQLPYVLMDYPRCFDGKNSFALRTMFWWGNFFSITLHLGGDYKTMFQQKIYANRALLNAGFFIGVNTNQWAHHFGKDNYLPFGEVTETQLQQAWEQQDFIKVALKYDLSLCNEMGALLEEGYAKTWALIA